MKERFLIKSQNLLIAEIPFFIPLITVVVTEGSVVSDIPPMLWCFETSCEDRPNDTPFHLRLKISFNCFVATLQMQRLTIGKIWSGCRVTLVSAKASHLVPRATGLQG